MKAKTRENMRTMIAFVLLFSLAYAVAVLIIDAIK